MQGMFGYANNSLIFRNIEPTSIELSILELPPPYVESQIVHPVGNVAEQSDDNFMDVQPLITTAKGKEKVVHSTSPSKNRTKQQTAATPRFMGNQHRHVVNPSIKKIPSIQPMKYDSPKKRASPIKEAFLNQEVQGEKSFVSPEVKDEFDDIRKLINDKFNSVMDVVKVVMRMKR
ncbi:hypothetical protein HAX54_016161 [Datura stramonium]|uniref:Uncharacterized protein n=1 Tax=Datura stramonium TaxID=4076 RepID=A0ABS8RZT8_DATST|nr:hypothetical protein [Datura stramonium]